MKKVSVVFEGPSGIGKTTLCEKFSDDYEIIPEVNQLFKNTNITDEYWYLKSQVKRFNLASKSKKPVIFDGDIFQPIWYNWAYNYPEEFLSSTKTNNFYEDNIINKNISFPDLYIIFYTSENELRRRKESDAKRQRKNFEKHLHYIKPQRTYFEYLQKLTSVKITFIQFLDIESTFNKVELAIKNTKVTLKNDIREFVKIKSWVQKNSLC